MLNFNENQDVYINQNFKTVHLTATEIRAKEFDNCTFTQCNFSESAFLNCKFYECNFINCNLSMISVKGCAFFDTVFEETKAIGINWTQAAWPNIKLSSPLRFFKCVLNHCSFFGLFIREIAITECSAKEVDFREADCTEADFTDTDLENSLFGKTNLTRADFSTAKNYHIDVFENEIKKAKFSFPEAVSLLNCLGIELVE